MTPAVGPNVVVTGAGTLDLSGLTFLGTSNFSSGIDPDQEVLGVGSPNPNPVDLYTGFSGPADFGSGGATIPRYSGSGDKVGLLAFDNKLGVSGGYVSGT